MVIFVLFLLLVIVNSAEIAPAGSFFMDYMSRKTTTAVKGVFVILIIFSHFSQYVTLDGIYDEGYVCLQSHLNQMVVAMFFFYSGYGIMESLKKKGPAYIRSFPVKRILTVFLDLAAAILAFLAVDGLLGIHYKWKNILLSFIGWSNVGNSSWYMFAIFCLYIGTWLSFGLFLKMREEMCRWMGTVLLTAFTLLFVYLQMKAGRPNYSYNTDILYVAGMWFSLGRNQAERVMTAGPLGYAICIAAVGAVYEYSFRMRWHSIEWYSIWGAAFTMLVLLFTMKVRIGNPILEWFGNHVFGVYILQRIPMMILSRFSTFAEHKYVFLVFVFLSLIPMVMIFDRIMEGINRSVGKLVRE